MHSEIDVKDNKIENLLSDIRSVNAENYKITEK